MDGDVGGVREIGYIHAVHRVEFPAVNRQAHDVLTGSGGVEDRADVGAVEFVITDAALAGGTVVGGLGQPNVVAHRVPDDGVGAVEVGVGGVGGEVALRIVKRGAVGLALAVEENAAGDRIDRDGLRAVLHVAAAAGVGVAEPGRGGLDHEGCERDVVEGGGVEHAVGSRGDAEADIHRGSEGAQRLPGTGNPAYAVG